MWALQVFELIRDFPERYFFSFWLSGFSRTPFFQFLAFGVFPNIIFSVFGFRDFPKRHFFIFWLSVFFPNVIFSVFGFRGFPERHFFSFWLSNAPKVSGHLFFLQAAFFCELAACNTTFCAYPRGFCRTLLSFRTSLCRRGRRRSCIPCPRLSQSSRILPTRQV